VTVEWKAPAYNSLWQVRTDAWSTLEETSAQLALAGAQERPVEQLTDTVAGVLRVLGPVERLWAFPGAQLYRQVERLFGSHKYEQFAAVVAGINRALITESYRGWLSSELSAAELPTTMTPGRPSRRGRTSRTSRCSSSRT
jgi:hypothetical protein